MSRAFTAASSHVIQLNTTPVTAPPFTFACWGNPATSTGTMLMELNVVGGTHRYALGLSSTVPYADQFDGTNTGTASHASTPSDGSWHHFCGVFTSNNSRTIYLNGAGAVTNTTAVAGFTPADLASLPAISVGARKASGSYSLHWDGSIAECAVWNVALEADEVATLATGASPYFVRPANLLCYFPLFGNESPELSRMASPMFGTVVGAVKDAHPRVVFPDVMDDSFITPVAYILDATPGTYTITGNSVSLTAPFHVVKHLTGSYTRTISLTGTV